MDCQASTSKNIKHEHNSYTISNNNYVDGYHKDEDTKDVKFKPKNQIKCEENCFAIVDKWYTKLIYKVPMENNLNKMIEREIVLMKVKYPFLTDKQRRGKALVKFGIPNSMGNILRTGSGKTTRKLSTVKSEKKIQLSFRIHQKFYYPWPLKSEKLFLHSSFANMDKQNLPSTSSHVADSEPDTTGSASKLLIDFSSRRRRFSKINMDEAGKNNKDHSNDEVLQKKKKFDFAEPKKAWPSTETSISLAMIELLLSSEQPKMETEKVRQYYDYLENKNESSEITDDFVQISDNSVEIINDSPERHENNLVSSTIDDKNISNFITGNKKKINLNEKTSAKQNIRAYFTDTKDDSDDVISISLTESSPVIISANQNDQSSENVPKKIMTTDKINDLRKILEASNNQEQISEQIENDYINDQAHNNFFPPTGSENESMDVENNSSTSNLSDEKIEFSTPMSEMTNNISYCSDFTNPLSFLSPLFTPILSLTTQSVMCSLNSSNFTNNLSQNEASTSSSSPNSDKLKEEVLNPSHPDYETYQLIERLRMNLNLQKMEISADDNEKVDKKTDNKSSDDFLAESQLMRGWKTSATTTPDLSQIDLPNVSPVENIWEYMRSQNFSNPGISLPQDWVNEFSPFSSDESENGDDVSSQDIKSPILGFVNESFPSTASCSQVFSQEKKNNDTNNKDNIETSHKKNTNDNKNDNLLSNVCSEYDDEAKKKECAPKFTSTLTKPSDATKKISRREIKKKIDEIIKFLESEDTDENKK